MVSRSCGVHIGGSLLYLVAGTDQVQAWAEVTEDSKKKDVTENGNERGEINNGYYRSFGEQELEEIQR